MLARVGPHPLRSPRSLARLVSLRFATTLVPRVLRHSLPADSVDGPLDGPIVSGMQPTGGVHIGNYLGSLTSWLQLQDTQPQGRLFFFLADHHAFSNALGSNQDTPTALHVGQSTYDNFCLLLAAGLDPDRSVFFVQSHVPAVCELTWMLSCLVPHSWLTHMHQFKDKETRNSALSLSVYPILMAADILAFRGRYVPVGADQVQHIELAQNIASRANNLTGKSVFAIPTAVVSSAPKIKSLSNPAKKMSKSDLDDSGRIGLLEPVASARQKIRLALTDNIPEVTIEETRKGLFNLASILGGLTGQSTLDVLRSRQGVRLSVFKDEIADALCERLAAIQDTYHRLHSERGHIREVMMKGQEEAARTAHITLSQLKERMTFIQGA